MLKQIILQILNFLTPTLSNRIYVKPLENSFIDKYDIINCNSSNLFKLLNYYFSQPTLSEKKIYLEYEDDSRLAIYTDYSNKLKNKGYTLKFIKKNNIIYNLILKCICKFYLIESGDYHYPKLKNHIQICANYFISCKNDLVLGNNYRWKDVDYIFTTALLPSQVLSASVGIKLDSCLITGFPRNDTLITSDKKKFVMNWLESIIGYIPKNIFLYIPTVRDYVNREFKNQPILGYESPELNSILENSKSVLIYKLHPYEKISIQGCNSNIIAYPKNYDFSLYDLMSITNCFIGDYSSATFDFLIKNKPIIYNLYDLEEYKEDRGLSYDPFEFICAGPIVKNWHEMKMQLLNVINGIDIGKEKRQTVTKLILKDSDAKSTERAFLQLCKILEK